MVFNIFTPTMIKSRARELDARVNALAQDMINHNLSQTEVGNNFGHWAVGWREFYAGLEESTATRSLNAVRDELDDYAEDFTNFAKGFKSATGAMLTVPTESKKWNPTSQNFPWAFLFVAGGGAFIAYKLATHFASSSPAGRAVSFVSRK